MTKPTQKFCNVRHLQELAKVPLLATHGIVVPWPQEIKPETLVRAQILAFQSDVDDQTITKPLGRTLPLTRERAKPVRRVQRHVRPHATTINRGSYPRAFAKIASKRFHGHRQRAFARNAEVGCGASNADVHEFVEKAR